MDSQRWLDGEDHEQDQRHFEARHARRSSPARGRRVGRGDRRPRCARDHPAVDQSVTPGCSIRSTALTDCIDRRNHEHGTRTDQRRTRYRERRLRLRRYLCDGYRRGSNERRFSGQIPVAAGRSEQLAVSPALERKKRSSPKLQSLSWKTCGAVRRRPFACCQGSREVGGPNGRTYSMTSSATASSVLGMRAPSALAVLRLMTSSNFVGCSTGISAGFAPFRILSTSSAARRYNSRRSVPYDMSPPASTNSRFAYTARSRSLVARSAMSRRRLFSGGVSNNVRPVAPALTAASRLAAS